MQTPDLNLTKDTQSVSTLESNSSMVNKRFSPPFYNLNLNSNNNNANVVGSSDDISKFQRKNPVRKSRLSVSDLNSSTLFKNALGDSSVRLSVQAFNTQPATSLKNKVTRKSVLPDQKPSNRISMAISKNKNTLDLYRINAKKTNNAKVQLEFAKFLFDLAIETSETETTLEADKYKEEALEWLQTLSKKNNPEAIYIIGTFYSHGIYGYKKDKSKAHSLFTKASKLNFGPAIDKIAYYYESKKDYGKSEAYYKKAAALGDPSANYRLGIASLNGELKTKRNDTNALFYLRRSAQLATEEFPQGAYIMALILMGLYEKDLKIRDEDEAAEYLAKSADLGYTKAQVKLGFCYEHGEYGYPVDPKTSIYYYRKAALKDEPNALIAMSGWYLTGAPHGILEVDERKALELCQRAVDKKLPKAIYAMGYFYEMGIEKEQNIQEAINWYTRALKSGYEEAKEKILELESRGLRREPTKKDSKLSKKRGQCIIS